MPAFHIVKALNDDGSVKTPTHLYDARDHCRRAMYDAAVAGILSARDWIAAFRQDYEGIVVRDVVPGWPEITIREKKARDLVGAGRYDLKSDGERVKEYLDTFRQLRDDVDLLAANMDDLNAKKLAMLHDQRWTTLTGVAGICSAIGALVGVLLSALIFYLSRPLPPGQ